MKVFPLIEVVESVAKTGKDGYTADFKILSPAKYADVEVRDFYYDKFGMGKFGRMAEAITGAEVESNKPYNVGALKGQRIKLYTEVKLNPNTGQPVNQIMDYANMNNEKATVRD